VSFKSIFQLLWTETWWTWNRPPRDPLLFHDFACHYFNLCEATVWFVIAALVLKRWWTFRRSFLEVGYAIAFLLFGISDVIEAWNLTSWLLWWKAINLVALFQFRRTIIGRYYPDRRLF